MPLMLCNPFQAAYITEFGPGPSVFYRNPGFVSLKFCDKSDLPTPSIVFYPFSQTYFCYHLKVVLLLVSKEA